MKPEGSIALHPKLGLNPHMTFCPRCGGDDGGIALLGIMNKVYTCDACGMQHWGFSRPPKGGCQRCRGTVSGREIKEHERMPGGLCKKCEAEDESFRKEVEAGGVYFRCKACGARGVVKAGTQDAKNVREKTGIEAPGPVGLEAGSCPKCQPEEGT